MQARDLLIIRDPRKQTSNGPLLTALLNRGAANNSYYHPALGYYLPLLNFISRC